MLQSFYHYIIIDRKPFLYVIDLKGKTGCFFFKQILQKKKKKADAISLSDWSFIRYTAMTLFGHLL